MKKLLILGILLTFFEPAQLHCQNKLINGWQDVQKRLDAREYHEALASMNRLMAINPPAGWMYFFRGVIYFDLNDKRSAIEDLRTARRMGYEGGSDQVNYLIFPEYLANEMARGFVDYPLTAENGFKPFFTRKDSLQGAMRPERSCYDVGFYDLKVEVVPSRKEISGSNAICFKVVNDTKRIQVDLFPELAITKMEWRHRTVPFKREFNAVFVDFPEMLKAGERDTLVIVYSGKPHIAINPPWNGGFVWEKKKGKDWVGVACEHLGASCWWPVKDYLADRPDSMRITVVTPPGYQGIANGNLRSVSKTQENWSYEWFVSHPITNYLVTLYVGDFINLQEKYTNATGTMPLDFYVLPHNEKRAGEYYHQAKKILEVFEKLYGDYPFPRDGAAWVEAPYEGMEHQGAIAIGDEYGKGERRDYEKCDYDYLMVHETAHEWWGNAVGMSEMADAWISEGFTTYSEFLFMEQVYGYDRYMNLALSNMKYILNIWPLVGKRDVNDNTFLGSDIYHKGAIMLHNLRCLLDNDSLFFGMIREFYRQNIYHSLTTPDFIRFANQYTGKNLSPFFTKYLNDKEPPILIYRYIQDGPDILLSYKWIEVVQGFEMPFLLYTGDGKTFRLNGTTQFQSVTLSNSTTFLVANYMHYPKTIPRNSLTWFHTMPDNWLPVAAYYPNGKKQLEGYMDETWRGGNWYEYYPDETVRNVTHFRAGKREGEAIGYSSFGKKILESNYSNDSLNGGFRLFYESGIPEVTGTFLNGNPDGEWKFYNPAGSLAASGIFAAGSDKENSWKYYNPDGKEVQPDSVCTSVNTPPHYFDGEEAMYTFVRNHLELPSKTQGSKPAGTVLISMVVAPNGTLRDFRIEKSGSPEIAEALVNAMKKMPRWAPGYLNGNPTNVKVIVPFRLNSL